ncbi:MAG: alpha/beta hydrolase [Chloroflexota bacterium]
MTTSNKFSIPFIDYGGSGEIIHFAHANGYPPGCYQPLFSLLTKNYHVLSMLQRPLWENSDPDEIKDWHPFTSDLLDFLDQQSLHSSIAIGHSLGGIASLRAAIIEPDRFKALVLIDPVFFSPFFIFVRRLIWSSDLIYRFHPLIKAARYRRRKFSDIENIFNGYRRKPIFRYMNDENLRAYIKGITVPDKENGYKLAFSPEWEMRIYATGIWNDLDLWKNISKIKIPVLVMRGGETDTFRTPAANLLRKRLPSAKLITIEETTHLVPLENPSRVNYEIVKFLQEKL